MPGKLLDTNAVIALQAGELAMVEFLTNNDIVIPAVAIGELCYGAYKSGRIAANLKVIDEFAKSNLVLTCNKATARFYGLIKQQLRMKGRPIPQNDVWIAAVARQYGLTLVTRDEHFKQVDDLAIEAW